MDQKHVIGLIVISTIWGVLLESGGSAERKWHTRALYSALVGAIFGALFSYSTYSEMEFPERGIEWSGTVLTCAASAGVLGAIAGAIRWRLAMRKARLQAQKK